MSEVYDAYFFDRNIAREVAMQQNHVTIFAVDKGLQVCYYDGQPFDDAPKNLINVPLHSFVDFFSTTNFRFPLDFLGNKLGNKKEEEGMARVLINVLEEIKKIRGIKENCYATILRNTKPDFKNDKPWRVFLVANRYTDVWQHCSKNLEKAFQKKGLNALCFIEENDMQLRDGYLWFKKAVEFKPHIWVLISMGAVQWLHPDVYHVIWWQDPRPPLGTGQLVNWRDKDIIFSQYAFVDDMLRQSGAKNIMRQGIGIDLDIYKPMHNIKRKRKAVFIGSSYIKALMLKCGKFSQNKELLSELEDLLNAGRPITRKIIGEIANKYSISPIQIYEGHLNYIVRERIVQWLCQCSDIEVEVYGRYWEDNEIVRPFFKGELPYGEGVAKIYNEATYALSLNPIEINTQRLAEIGACGCIPVVYDCRHMAEKPHWDDECLFFRTKDDLYACFDRIPSGDPLEIGRAFSYDRFADKIISIIEEREGVSAFFS